MNRADTLKPRPGPGGKRGPHLPTLVGGTLLTVVFVAAFVSALEWDSEAAIFPLAVSGFGAVLGLCVVCRTLLWPQLPSTQFGEDAQDDTDNAFASASRRNLLTSLACFAGFFLLLYILGLYVAVPLFTFLYLMTQAEKSWIFSAVYSGALVLVLYVLFDVIMQQPVPSGPF